MDTSPQSLSQWAQEAGRFSPPEWDRLPEIYLYMDQVLSYMDKQLELFERNPEDPLLTSSMVNNYVKAGVLPRPEQKKIFSRASYSLNSDMLDEICPFYPRYIRLAPMPTQRTHRKGFI